MNADTLTQIDGVRIGDVTDRHAWLLSEIWRLVWPLGIGPGWVLTATLITFVFGGYLVLRAALHPIPAAICTAVVAVLPQDFGALALLGRDMWFATLLLAGFGCLIAAAARPGRAQIAFLVTGIVACALAQAARQNGITATAVCFIAAAMVIRSRRVATGRAQESSDDSRARRVGGYMVAGALASVAVVGVLAAAKPLFSVQSAHPDQYLYIYDLAALSLHDERVLFAPSTYPKQDLPTLKARFAADNVVPLVVPPDPPVTTPLPERGFAQLKRRWKDAVLDEPLEYLDIRTDLFLRQLAITQKPTQIYHPVIDGNPFGYSIRFTGPSHVAKSYVEAFADPQLNGDILHATWIYLLIAGWAAVILLRAPTLALKIAGLLAVAAITYQVGLFLGATGVGLRLEDPTRMMALFAGIVAAGHLITRRRRARSSAVAPDASAITAG
jgi:hypothetical protein